MPLPAVRLSAPGLTDLDLDPFAGWIVQSLDLGDPVTREVTQDAPDADGTIDTTALLGARAVTLAMVLAPRDGNVEALEHRLKAFMSPRLRPRMFVTRSDGVEKVLTLRRQSYSGPIEVPDETLVVAQWVAPSGIIESAVQHVEVVRPGVEVADGIEFDGIEFDGVEFPLVDPVGSGQVTNAGDVDAYPLLRLYGPFGDTDPGDETVIANVTAGRQLVFAGLQVLAGDYLEIDMRAKTAQMNGVPGQANSRLNMRVFPGSAWWTLASGTSEVAFRPDTFSGNSQMHVIWRDAWG